MVIGGFIVVKTVMSMSEKFRGNAFLFLAQSVLNNKLNAWGMQICLEKHPALKRLKKSYFFNPTF